MRNAVLIATAGLLVAGAYVMTRRPAADGEAWAEEPEAAPVDDGPNVAGELVSTAEEVLTGATESAAEFVDNITGGILRVSAMARVNPADLNNPNVQALLRVIRAGEGTAGPNGYRTLFGGQLFDGYADHPRIKVTRGRYTSTAAGAYQFLASTWDETARIMGLPDFSPRSQDLGALGRLAARGALWDAKAGNIESAIRKIAKEWASLPGSPYGQPTISWERALGIYASAGGETMTA